MSINQNLVDFRHSLERGTGDAILAARQCRDNALIPEILRACRIARGDDPQCEGHRAVYLVDIIFSLAKPQELVSKLLGMFRRTQCSGWDLNQYFELLCEIYRRTANPAIPKLIEGKYLNINRAESSSFGEEALVKSMGLAGLKIVAQTRGGFLVGEDQWESNSLVVFTESLHPEVNVKEELTRWSESNEQILRYFNCVFSEDSSLSARNESKLPVLDSIIINIDALRVVPASPRDVNSLSDSDVECLAVAFRGETNRLRAEKYLRIFSHRKYPFEFEDIFKWAVKRPLAADRLVEFACKSLGKFHDDAIRNLAIRKLDSRHNVDSYIYLLTSNYADGDGVRLRKFVDECRSYQSVHDLCWPIVDIYNHGDFSDCKVPLEKLYYRMNCGICREKVVAILKDRNLLTPRMIAEIQHDSYEGIREIGKKVKQDLDGKT